MNWFKIPPVAAATPSTTATRNAADPNNPQATILTLRETINQQDKREAHIQLKVDALVLEAKTKMAAGDKKGALFAMKRKKMYEGEIEKIINTKMTLETQVMNLESATGNKDVIIAIKIALEAMKIIRQEMEIENVDEMMDDIREEMEMANQISNAIAQPVDFMPVDEDELWAELHELWAELQELEMKDTESQLLNLKQPAKSELDLPTVPNTRLPAKKQNAKQQEEEDAWKELQALMS